MDSEKEEDKKISKNVPDDDEKSITSQVLEYYQRYSQNRDLPKYFCGDTAIKPQDWQLTKIDPIKIDICTDNVQPVLTDIEKDIPKITIESICAPSPTSSVTSNRKLEWDNGADIGYSHSNIHKSISLPTLINNLELDKLRAKFKNGEAKKHSNDVSVDANVKFSYSSSSESTRSSRKGYILSTPSDSNQELLSDSEMCRSDHLKDLKSNVGLPIAESTPIVGEYCLTPHLKENVSEKLDSQIDLNMVDRISRYKNMKVLKLTVSNTVVVECAGATEPLHGKNKFVQTSPQTNPTIGIQTDFDYTDCYVIKPSVKSSERQNVFYMCFTESDSSATPCSTMQTQTNSIEVANCDSFEYVDGAIYPSVPVENKLNEYSTPQETKPLDEAEESPLSTLLRKNLASNNIKELQRNIDVLQKLINSQKYDSVTKKYYVKKILQRILDNKSPKFQSELSTSSKSEKENKFEQEIPSRTLSDDKSESNCLYSKVPPRSILSESSKKVNSPSEVSEIPSENALVKDTISREHDILEVPVKNTKKNRLGVHSFSNDIFSKEEPSTSGFIPLGAKYRKLRRSPLLTLTDGGNSLGNDCIDDEKSNFTSGSQTKRTEDSQGSSSSLKESEVGNKHRNWRDSKTNSEINLEQRIGDCNYPLINFAKKERDTQLYWINNEIVHLNKLKKVLEVNQTDLTSSKLDKITRNPRIEDMNGIKKQTTVYVLSTERENSPNSRFSPSQSSRDKSHKKCDCKPPSFVNNSAVEIGNGKINLHNAQLVGSEEFTSNSKDKKCTTVVRRYTFEISSEPEQQKNAYDSKVLDEPNREFKKPDSPVDLSTQSSLKSSSKNSLCFKCKSSKKRPYCTCPKGPIIVKEESLRPTSCRACSSVSYDKASNLTKQLVLTDEITGKKCKCMKNNDTQAHECLPCGRKPVLTCNLVMADEIPSSDALRSRSICSKLKNSSESESNCNCAKLKKTQSESTSSETSTFCTCKPKLCYCCRQQQAVRPSGPCRCCKTNDNNSDPEYLLCYPCYQHHGVHQKPYLLKTHICECDVSDTVKKVKQTIKQLQNLESETELCQCPNTEQGTDSICCKCNRKLKSRYRRRKGGLAYALTLEPDENLPTNEKKILMESLQEIKIKIPSPRKSKSSNTSTNSSSNKNMCSKCCCKLKSEDSKGTKETTDEDLEEIIIQVPKSSKKNSKKDNSVKDKKKRRAEKKNNRNVVVCTCICGSNSLEPGFSRNKDYTEESNYSSEVSDKTEPNDTEKKLCGCQPSECKCEKSLSLQEYLRKNNPNFVSNAEERRKLLNKLSHNRGQQYTSIKESLILSRNHPYKSHKSHDAMFSTREMKRITAKNYKNCREFQQKLTDVREREIKRCNRLLYDLFNKRLREQVLKGRHTLPLEASIINLR